MNDLIKATEEFLRESMDACSYYDDKQAEKEYRIEHSYRVANIGKEIAEKEGLNVLNMTLGCLLHDIGYSLTCPPEEYVNHGRYGAKIARTFLIELGLDLADVEEICYGIAIHVDDKADFEGERTKLAVTIGEADNIDRFDAYRLYETLCWKNFDKMPLQEKEALVNHFLTRLSSLLDQPFVTATSKQMWVDKIQYQIGYYERLQQQFKKSRF